MTEVNNENSSPVIPVTSEEVARQVKAVTDPLSEQLELLCDLMKDLQQSTLRCNKETSSAAQNLSRAPNFRSAGVELMSLVRLP